MSSRDLDKFYTAPHIVDHILNIIDFSDYNVCIEPSAGSGAFSILLSEKIPTLAYDIHPEHPTIKRADYLTLDIDSDIRSAAGTEGEDARVMVVGNPPFGKQASLACKFFNKSAFYPNVNLICMIFPKSFKKISIQNRLNLEFHCVHQEDIPKNSYLLNDQEYDVPTVFQIWKRYPLSQKRKKKYSESLKDGMVFTKQPVEGDVAIRRVGGKAGYTSLYNNQSKQSFYFIRFLSTQAGSDYPNIDTFISELNSIEWEYNDTVGPRSISKYQLVPIINNIFIQNQNE